MLCLEGIHTYYGQSHVLQGVSLEVRRGEVVALLGRNGAGKTTTMRTIIGLTPAREGTLTFRDIDLRRRAVHAIARLGVGYVPSGRRTFSSLTVRQNLLLSTHGSAAEQGAWTLERVFGLFPKLRTLETRRAGHLSGGEQQMLKLARALLGRPKLLLLDEPSEGLAPLIVGQLREWLATLKSEGLDMLISEQNTGFALALADRAYIIEKGQIRHTAAAKDLLESDEIRRHLGV